ncbi:hypothetical protein C8R44DRAFT_976095 [Mycena epipterygia]|nr:hypothetical protein C8R44DRAFT_976095 [Mycena epipterygia]
MSTPVTHDSGLIRTGDFHVAAFLFLPTISRRGPSATESVLAASAVSKSPRNVLNADIKYYAAKQDKINDELRSENKQLHATLAAMQATITRLTFASPAPLRPRSPSPILPRPRSRSPQAHLPRRQAPAHAAKVARSRSPTSDAPQKRQRVLHGKEGFLTMGPLRECQLSPLELFEKMVSDTLPTFTLTRPYTVIVDPVYPYHLRVTLDSVREAADLAQAWETGHHAVGVRVMLSDGCNESASNAGSSGHVQRNGGQGSGARRHTSTSSMRGRK